MYETMIDIETLNTTNKSVIFQVGLIFFDDTKQYKYIWNLDINEQLELGRTIDASTLAFHLKIPDNLLDSIEEQSHYPIIPFKVELEDLFLRFKPEACWSKGYFDFALLTDLLHGKVPWEFWTLRELRTIMKECNVQPSKEATHNALEDCKDQIEQLLECRRKINERAQTDTK